ncbi:TetR/AcrR family transcriptional regulator [Nocardioides sp. C4-1]|uniref:TetR/AcrR family transcriptional regulator n=1 Tax=Nocardioides sp. C4-1 TaxID=3151851 RepID=UPI003263EF92
MSPRKYEQVVRAENAAQTRSRIIEAVGAQLRESPTEPLGLDRVAQEAGVARSTIYTSFGSRGALISEFLRDLWDSSAQPFVAGAAEADSGVEHLRATIDATSRLWEGDAVVWRAVRAMDLLDPDSSDGQVRELEEERKTAVDKLARRLRKDGALRAGVTPATAGHTLWVLTSFETFDALRADRGAGLAATIRLLTETAERSLLA